MNIIIYFIIFACAVWMVSAAIMVIELYRSKLKEKSMEQYREALNDFEPLMELNQSKAKFDLLAESFLDDYPEEMVEAVLDSIEKTIYAIREKQRKRIWMKNKDGKAGT